MDVERLRQLQSSLDDPLMDDEALRERLERNYVVAGIDGAGLAAAGSRARSRARAIHRAWRTSPVDVPAATRMRRTSTPLNLASLRAPTSTRRQIENCVNCANL